MPVARKANTANTAEAATVTTDGHEHGTEVIVAGGEQHGGGIAADGKQAGVAQGREAGIADEQIERQGQNGPDQDLAGDIDVVGVADPDGQADEQHKSKEAQGAPGADPTHVTTLPNSPCGRSTRITSIGKNRMT